MHIPDGWLSIPVILISWAIVITVLSKAFSKIRQTDIEQVSNIGTLAAVVFVAQMFNFPVAGGTSGHLLGASLAVYVVGLSGTFITLFSVLLVQAVVFADGGILALGANTLNMGIIGGITAYFIKRVFAGSNKKMYYAGIFVSSFSAVVVSSFFAGVELLASGLDLNPFFTLGSIFFWHVLIGIGEGLLTMFIIAYLQQVGFKLDSAESSDLEGKSSRVALGVAGLLAVLSVLALFASSSPDGLEYVAEELRLRPGTYFELGIADGYAFLGMDNVIGTLLSAVLGITILVGILVLPVAYIKEKRTTVAVN